MRASPAVVSRERLESLLWGDDPPDADMLRSHVYELRKSSMGYGGKVDPHAAESGLSHRGPGAVDDPPDRPPAAAHRHALASISSWSRWWSTHGYIVNERAELLVWQSLLQSELTISPTPRRESRQSLDGYGNVEALRPFGGTLPQSLPRCRRGFTTRCSQGGAFVALVSGTEHGNGVLALDISDIERREQNLTLTMSVSTAVVVALLAMITYGGVGWLVRPLSSMANTIRRSLRTRGQRLAIEASAPREARVIAEALNEYLQRLDQFVERERTFVNMASHELRTPIAVISGPLRSRSTDTTAAATLPYLERILRTARDMERLVTLLVALAKDPARLRAADETVELASCSHRSLPITIFSRNKELSFELDVAAAADSRSRADRARGDRQPGAQRDREQRSRRDRSQRERAASGHRGSRAWHVGRGDERVYTRMARSGEMPGTRG